MNKNREALSRLHGMIYTSPFSDEKSNLDYNDLKIYNTQMQKEFLNNLYTLQELVDKEEKYRWHDLFKDCKDLPKSGTDVLVYRKVNETKCEYAVDRNYNDGRYEAWGSDIDGYTVIKWKYIEEAN